MQGNKLYVGNLTYSVTDEQLEKLFSQYGEVKEVNLIGSKGFGFVEMATNEEAEKAKEALPPAGQAPDLEKLRQLYSKKTV